MSFLICKLICLSQAKCNLAKAILGVLEQVEQFQGRAMRQERRATRQEGRATRQGAFLSVILHVCYVSEGRYALGKVRYALRFSPNKLPASYQILFSLKKISGRPLLHG